MKSFALVIALVVSSSIYSQLNIVPEPVSIIMGNGSYILPVNVRVESVTPTPPGATSSNEFTRSSEFLLSYLAEYYKSWADASTQNLPPARSRIILGFDKSKNAQPGSYTLEVTHEGIAITGYDEEGVFYGIQTLIQLLPPHLSNNTIQIPYVTIKDHPRFAYRGLHLDVGRHFMPVEFIKKYIDFIAYHKLNYFHWHLTEDQGWRIEIKKYPKLTQVGAWRNGTIIGRYPGRGNDNKKHGGFYSQVQIKEIVNYAADRYITIIPEIEMPGHSSAAIASYPSLSCFPSEPTIKYFPKVCKWSGDSTGKQVQQTWGVFSDVFCAGKEETFKFLQDVIDEVAALFPGKYIHVGGDECPKANWKRCPNCQQRIKDNKLKDEHELQSYFIRRMEKYLNDKGKTLIGWDEILEGGLAPNAVVMSWRGEEGGIAAAKEKHNVIMTPDKYVYYNYSQTENEDSVTIGGYLPLEMAYNYEPIPGALNEEQSKYVLGAQANMWTEYTNNTKIVEYMLFPRLSALSELLWTPKEKKSWNDFEKKLPMQFKRYELWKASYSRAYYDLKATVIPSDNYDGVLWKLETKNPSATIKTVSHFANRPYELKFSEGNDYAVPIPVKSTQLVAAISMISGKPVSNPISQNILFNKATGKRITLGTQPSTTYKADGAFTLVNGIQNEKGLAKRNEFLGFSGTDCEAVIDLGKEEKISSVIVHAFHEPGSWIHRPRTMEVFVSGDNNNFSSVGSTGDFIDSRAKTGNGTMKVELKMNSPLRHIKVIVKNWGEILQGNPGAGSKAWLFIDEIEIN